MNLTKKFVAGLAVLGIALIGCSGDDTNVGSSSAPEVTEAPATTVEETAPPTTAAPTTVEETTTTASIDYSYTIDTTGFIYDNNNQFFSPIPDEPGVAFDSVHPEHEGDGAVPLRDVASLDEGSEVCFHGPGGDETVFIQMVQIFSTLDSSTGETTTVLEVTYTDLANDGWINFAEELGLSPFPDGTWKEGSYVTIGSCA